MSFFATDEVVTVLQLAIASFDEPLVALGGAVVAVGLAPASKEGEKLINAFQGQPAQGTGGDK